MRILVIGSGGREHALAWACAKDTATQTVFVAPGNAGTALEPKVQNVDLDTGNHQAIVDFCKKNAVEFVLVGPEAPLVDGLVDSLRAADVLAWGPCAYCAQLEGSKDFAKAFMQKHGIPTANYQTFSDAQEACAYIAKKGAPIVVKADGLAAGKGVVVANDVNEAQQAARDMLADNKFGQAGSRVVIEDFLQGEEASFICMIDGDNILPMATSQDHKRIFEGDKGDNTGGMGAYSPAPVVSEAVHAKVIERIVRPVVDAMKANGTPYTGFLYAGLMIDDKGDPYVVEFNCRFGDPETQPVLMRLQSNLSDLIRLGLKGALPTSAQWSDKAALGIVLASRGYPQSSGKDDPISGLDALNDNGDLKVFHAGTKNGDDGQILTNGGRVLCVTALGDDIQAAQTAALAACAAISFDGMQYRRDIGWRAVQKNTP